MYRKLAVIMLTFSLSSPLMSSEDEIKINDKEVYAWSKQIEYMDILKELKVNFEKFNNELSNCRELFFINQTEENKKLYLLDTNEYSTNILVTQALVSQALDNLELKIENNKDSVMNNLIEGFEKLDSYIEYEKERKNKLIKNYKSGYKEIENKYCPIKV
jgi:hypothetical protein